MSGAFDLDRIVRDAGVATVDYHESILSTNTRGLELAACAKQRLPLLILANEQQAGRGRGTNQWWSGSGALTFSLLCDSAAMGIPPQHLPLVSLTIGLAVADAIEQIVHGCDVRLKWPNDVYLSGRKVCGILVETSSQRAGLIVIGVGINVNNSLAEAPRPLGLTATSLIDATGREWDRTELLITLLRCFTKRLESIGHGGQLADAWRQRCYLQGRTLQLDTGTRRITGVCQGIDDQGALLLFTEEGIQRCFAGVVARII